MKILDMAQFTRDGIVRESEFFDQVDRIDWSIYSGERVLIKGCGTTLIPPWAFMAVAARLTAVAKVIKYGNEHSSITIFRSPKTTMEKDYASS